MGALQEVPGQRSWRIGRYLFRHECYPPGAPGRTWSCGVRWGPAGPLGAGGCKGPVRAFLAALRFERAQVAAQPQELTFTGGL